MHAKACSLLLILLSPFFVNAIPTPADQIAECESLIATELKRTYPTQPSPFTITKARKEVIVGKTLTLYVQATGSSPEHVWDVRDPKLARKLEKLAKGGVGKSLEFANANWEFDAKHDTKVDDKKQKIPGPPRVEAQPTPQGRGGYNRRTLKNVHAPPHAQPAAQGRG